MKGQKEQNKVLIVDDVPENLELLGNILNDQGIEISFATNGKEALNIVQYDIPDLILLDIAMPEMDGYEVFERLKEKDETASIPIIFLTAKNQIQDVIKGFNIGAVDYVTKPFNATELTARIFNHLELYHSRTVIDRQNRQLQELNEIKDKVFSIVTQDLKNPFHSLIGFAELLLKEHKDYDPGKMEKYLQQMYQTAKQGYNLLENVSEWARLQSGNVKIINRRVTLYPLVVNLLAPYQQQAKAKGITLDNFVDESLNVHADVQILKLIIRNLLSNAIKYTDHGGHVKISTKDKDYITEVIVEDNGIGVPEEKHHTLLNGDPQQSTLGTDNEKGTGIGLMLCKQLIDKMNGKIWFDSTPGKGSAFHFTVHSDQSDLLL